MGAPQSQTMYSIWFPVGQASHTNIPLFLTQESALRPISPHMTINAGVCQFDQVSCTTHALMARPELTNLHATRVFCCIPVQGFGGPRLPPNASRTGHHCTDAASASAYLTSIWHRHSNLKRPTWHQWWPVRETFGGRPRPPKRPRRTFACNAGVFFVRSGRAIYACD